jgi:hypothetical protein
LKLKKDSNVFVITYWVAQTESLEDAIDFDINKYQITADVVCWNLLLDFSSAPIFPS